MTSRNTYFDAIKPFAKSIQEKATKLTDVIDEKLKKTQENLERQRVKASEPHLWRPSGEHSLGEIIVIPPPISTTPPTTPTTPLSPENPKFLTVVSEPQTITRKRSRRPSKRNDFETDIERKQQVNHCLNDIINEIIEKESTGNCLDQLIDIVITMDEEASFITTSTEDNSTVEFNSMDNIDTNEDHSKLLETQSNAIEIDVPDPMDTSLEKSDLHETDLSIAPYEEHFDTDIYEFSSPQTNTLETSHSISDISKLLNSLIINTEEDSPVTPPSITPNVIEPPIVELPELPITTMIEKETRFSVLNHYSIPPDVIVSHMSCSSTYIYICTNQQSLFYAKFPENNLNHSLQWFCYSLPADQLIVSDTNQTIWRVFNKCIYSSNDPIKVSALGIQWTEMSFFKGQSLLSISINDQYGWYIKEDGTLWLIKTDDQDQQSLNVPSPFHFNRVVCSVDKTAVTTSDGQILIRIGCTNECPEGDGWIFIEHTFGPFDDFTLIKNKNNMICIIDKKHRIWIHDWSSNGKFHEVICNDDYVFKSNHRYLIDVNDKFLCFTDCQDQLYTFSDCFTGIHWSLSQKDTRLQRLIGVFPDENHVWALTTDGTICSSDGHTLEKPRQAQYLTHASFVPDTTSQNTVLWSLDESCNIYIRNNVDINSQWEQLDQSQFDWNRRLVHIVCNTVGVWAVDDRGCVHFRHGHISNSNEYSLLNPAWIPIPGEAHYHRSFSQIFCGPEEWMVYATDNKQTVYVRIGLEENDHIGTSWKVIEDCSALELAISDHTLWLLTSHGRIQCRENISVMNPMGTRLITLPGRFNSITVSIDDSQFWALYPQHHLFKLDRLTNIFEK